jgi:hypothetical protein
MNCNKRAPADYHGLRELAPSELTTVEGGMWSLLPARAAGIVQRMLSFLPPLNLLD